MSRRARGPVVTGITVGVATYALLASGILGSTAGALLEAARPPTAAAAEGLPGFADCEQLRRWHVRTALPDVGPEGLDGPPVLLARRSVADVTAADVGAVTSPEAAVGTSGAGTNVQEDGVDEPDLAKTDGRVLVRISGPGLVVTDVSGDRPRELSRTALPARAAVGAELVLRGDRVLVLGRQGTRYGGPMPLLDGVPRSWPAADRALERTRLLSFDIGDPSAPRLVDDRSLGGRLVSARLYADGIVRLAIATRAPELPFVRPGGHRSAAEATLANRRVLRAAPATAWLPTVRSGAGGERPLVRCDEVRHPRRAAGLGTVSVVGFAVDAPDRDSVTAVTAAGDLVYSSARRLYVATHGERSTSVHAFGLDAGRTSYVASGSVPGLVKDRWSFSERDGHLRVATTSTPAAFGRPASAVRVLVERGGRLVETGHVGGLGVDEELKSVRWFGDLAVVVTFRQTDPLFTVDLADPSRPRLLGQLKVPGFSSYLHPVGGDLLVGLGRDATLRGADRGAQAATFDLGDLGEVRRRDTLDLGRDTWLPAGEDPHAAVYLPEQRLLVTSISDWRGTRFLALQVSPTGELTRSRSWPAGPAYDAAARALPLGDGRVALVDDGVRLVSVARMG